MASSKETYCLCGQPYNIGQFMIECDCCREWFHGSCVDVKIYQSDDIDKYHCPKCVHIYGPSVLKIPTNNHRGDRYEIGAESKPAQIGSPAWVRALAARPLRPMAAALQRMKGYQFTEEFVRDGGFVRPILFTSPEGLELTTPNPATFTVRSVLRYCGAQLEVEVIDVRKQATLRMTLAGFVYYFETPSEARVEVIDVRKQATLRMTLADFVDYFETPPEARVEKVLNVLSLEFSDTNLSPLVEPPAVAVKLDWAATVWPSGQPPPKPSVQKYCLLSSAGSYTDWHLDFGGSTVWYHLLHGRKIFYLAPPTPANLTLYQQWSASSNRERFFGDLLEWYGTCELIAGQSLFIPSGWIHAVYTPTDSLVFGGNLLHSYSIESQLQVYEMERRVETPMMFRYPLFEPMCWYAAAHLLTLLHRHNEDSQDEDFRLSESESRAPVPQLPPLLVKGVKVLANVLKEWHSLKSTDTAKRDNVPKCLNSGQLVRELAKELRIFEKRSSSVKDKEHKVKNNASPKKHTNKNSQKKSLKLTLPKPIVTYSQNGEFEEKPPKNYIEDKDIYQEQAFISEDLKYNGLEEAKAFSIDGKPVVIDNKSYVYQNYDEHLPSYVETNGYIERHEKKNGGSVLRIKLNNNPSSSREAPPPYSLPEHSILKSHLIGRIPSERLPPQQQPVKPLQQWTISKKELGEYQEEQILYTNENVQSVHQNVHSVQQNVQNVHSVHQNIQNLHQNIHSVHQNVHSVQQNVHSVHQNVHSVHQSVQNIQGGVQTIQGNVQTPDMGYGPGMYSTEDIHQDYQYDAKPYQPDYSYQPNMPQPELGMAQQDLSMAQQDLRITQQDLTMAQQELTMTQQDLPLTQVQYTVENPQYIATRYEIGNVAHTHHQTHQNPTYQQIVSQDNMNGTYQEQLPTYDAAIAQQHYQANTYVVESHAPAPSVRRSVRAVRRRVSPTYEYSDAELYIDEERATTRRRRKNNYTHHAASSTSYRPPRGPRPAPANGIESLIQASQLAAEPNDTEDAAVAGMLSIGSRYTLPPPPVTPPSRTFGLATTTHTREEEPPPPSKPSSPTKRSRGSAAAQKREEYASDEENDVIKEVHRDDEYVYPALDLSSDEDEEWTASKRPRGTRSRVDSRSKSDKDVSWSPRGGVRVRGVVPRARASRSARRERECVRAALTAARERGTGGTGATKVPPDTPHASTTPQSAKRAVLATKSKRPPAPVQTSPKNSNARLKKGMKTAKQRLGKILKLHKMMH